MNTNNMEDSYNNPFSDYNANVMDSDKIIEYWCSPFRFTQSATISESDIYRDGMSIIFMGGRGTGKTMFLRYFSYSVQQKEALREIQDKKCDTIISYIKKKGGIGFYLRFDGPALHSFEGKGLQQEKWDDIFTHYFELQVCQSYIEVIRDIINSPHSNLNKGSIEKKFVPLVAQLIGENGEKSETIDDILSKIEAEIAEVTRFRGQIAFSDIEFRPSRGFTSQSLSFGIAKIAKESIEEFRDINFVVFIDEFENFLEHQQRIVNTLLKFVHPGITFRIGMRLEGFHTFSTISKDEFIKEGRDYRKFIFEHFLTKDKDYQEFLKNVARKRLEMIPILKEKNYLDISNFLGTKEDLNKEAYELVHSRDNKYRHFELLTQVVDKSHIDDIRKIINYPNNPLLEMLNILWVIRGKEPKDVQRTMNDYLNHINSDDKEKYQRDYVDKYKLSLMFLLASIYRINKEYYSFNTFCFLSSGIVGHFIELCRKSFQYAYFENRKLFLDEGKIPSELQDRAARDLAASELEMIPRIEKYGDNLYLFKLWR